MCPAILRSFSSAKAQEDGRFHFDRPRDNFLQGQASQHSPLTTGYEIDRLKTGEGFDFGNRNRNNFSFRINLI